MKKISFVFCPIIFMLFLICMAKSKNPDNDMWWMMATGRHIWENKALPVINPFVIHEEFSIIVQQWLLAILNYLTYKYFGRMGLVILSLMVIMLNSYLLKRYISFFIDERTVRGILVYIGIIICSAYLNTRPTQFTIAILLMEQIVVLNYKKTANRKILWLLPILSLIEINLHGSFWVFLFIMLLPHLVPDVLSDRSTWMKQIKEKKDYLLPVIVSAVVGMVNPNGINAILYLFKSYKSTKLFQTIVELKSPALWTLHGIMFMVAGIVLVIYILRNREELDMSKLYMGFGVLVLAAKHKRNIWFLIFLIIPMGKYLIRELETFFTKINRHKVKKTFQESVERVFVTSFYVLVVIALVFSLVYIPDNSKKYIPMKAEEYLNQFDKEEVRLYTSLNIGGYMEWMGYKVYIDARPELYTKVINGKADVADEYYDIMLGIIDYEQFLEKYDFTHIITEANGIFNTYLMYNSKYHLINNDGNYVLYEK